MRAPTDGAKESKPSAETAQMPDDFGVQDGDVDREEAWYADFHGAHDTPPAPPPMPGDVGADVQGVDVDRDEAWYADFHGAASSLKPPTPPRTFFELESP